MMVQVSETSSPSPQGRTALCSAARTASRSSFPGRGVQPGETGSAGQPAAARAVLEGEADAFLHAGDDVPACAKDRGDQVIAGKIPVKAGHAAGEQVRAAAREAGQQGLLPGPGPAQDRAGHGAAGAGSQRDDPQLRERRGALPVLLSGARAAERLPVRFGVREVHEHPVGGARHHPGQQHRRRLSVADQRPGRPPEQVLHHIRRDRQPPGRDDLLRGHVPFQGERDVREQPGQLAQGLAVRRVRHQGHREHQPDDQRIGHDPPPLPPLQPALLQRRVRYRLDHPVAEVPLQLAQPHEIRQPPVRQHAAVPADDGRRGHHRAAEHRQLAR